MLHLIEEVQPLGYSALRRDSRSADINAVDRLYQRCRCIVGRIGGFRIGRGVRTAVRLRSFLLSEIRADRTRSGLRQRQRLRKQSVLERDTRDDIVHLTGFQIALVVFFACSVQRGFILRDNIVNRRECGNLRLIFLLFLFGGVILVLQRFVIFHRRTDEIHAENDDYRQTCHQPEQLFITFGYNDIHSAASSPSRIQFRLRTYTPSS